MFQLSYWEERYKQGGVSGEGSVDKYRTWKWKIIDCYVKNIDDVVDVGCGDISFWLGRECKKYTGVDISQTVIDKNKLLRPNWEFIRASSDKFLEKLNSEIVFCFDVLFHIMDPEIFSKTLENICQYSSKFVFIYTWKNNPFSRSYALGRIVKKQNLGFLKYVFFPTETDGKYQYFRPLDNYSHIFEKYNFELISENDNPDKLGCMYVFAKKD